jgi:uncharacterized LabA/DUF88 family protein
MTAGDQLGRDDRVALLIDETHYEWIVGAAGTELDLVRVRDFFEAEGVVIHARYYSAAAPAEDDQERAERYESLALNGFEVVIGGRGPLGRKSNPLIRLAVDAMDFSGGIDHFVIMGGDSGLASLAASIQRTGGYVTALSAGQGANRAISDDFRRAADRYLDAFAIVRAT